MALDLRTRFSKYKSTFKLFQSLECKNNVIFFTTIGSKEKIPKTEIENKLGISTFNKLHFYKCDLSKAYKVTFEYLIRNHVNIISLEMYAINDTILTKINDILIKFLSSSCCSNLIKLGITSTDTSSYNLTNIFNILSQSNTINNTLKCIQINGFSMDKRIKLNILSQCLIHSSIKNNNLQIIDFRNLGFSGKQNYELSVLLTSLLWNKKKNQRNKKYAASYNCSISEFYFGGNDKWTQKGIEEMCRFLKYNHNLEIVGLDLQYKPKDKPFLNAADSTSIGLFLLSFEDHPAMYRLEMYNISTYTLKTFGDIWAKRIKGNKIRLTELYVHQIMENTFADPRDGTVLPSLTKITKKIPWLQLLHLKISVFCSLPETKEICKLLKNCQHLNGIKFQCNIGEMFSKKQILLCVNEIVKIFKQISSKNIQKEKNQLIQIICNALSTANDNNRAAMDRNIAQVILSYADVSYAFDAGLLFFESTFLNKLSIKDRKNVNDFLLNNWRKLPYFGRNIDDKRYKLARAKIIKLDEKINGNKNKNKNKNKQKIKHNNDDNDDIKQQIIDPDNDAISDNKQQIIPNDINNNNNVGSNNGNTVDDNNAAPGNDDDANDVDVSNNDQKQQIVGNNNPNK